MIAREEVLAVARLARLELSEEQLEPMARELSAVLDHIAMIGQLDLSDVPPTSHPLDVVNVWEDDSPKPCLTAEEALANAPEREGDFFKVPPGGSS